MFLRQVLIFLLLMNKSISVYRLLLLQRHRYVGKSLSLFSISKLLLDFLFRAFLDHKHRVKPRACKCFKSSPSLTKGLILEDPEVTLVFSAPCTLSRKSFFSFFFILSFFFNLLLPSQVRDHSDCLPFPPVVALSLFVTVSC